MVTIAIATMAMTMTSDGTIAAVITLLETEPLCDDEMAELAHSHLSGASITTTAIDPFTLTCEVSSALSRVDKISMLLQLKCSQILLSSKSTEML